MPKIYKPQNELGNNLVDITKIGYNNGNEFKEGFTTIENKIQLEEERAAAEEEKLQQAVDAEKTRAIGAETQLQTNIDNEETRAASAESALNDKITAETNRATEAENNLQEKINEEYERAVDVETKLQENITNESAFRQLSDNDLQQQIYAEIADAKQRESIIADDLITETERATSAESDLNDKITAEETRATGVESELDTRISDLENSVIKIIESDSYINANNTEANKVNLTVNVSTGNNNSSVSSADEENTLTRVKDVNAAITYEVNRATTKENELNAAITAEVSRAEGVESGFNTRITTLESDSPKIISVTGQIITNPTEITMGSEVIFSTDSNIAIDTALSSITQNTSIGWTVKNTNATGNISITNNSEVVKSIEPNTSISGKWIKNTEGITISVFKRALGEEGMLTITRSDDGLTYNIKYPEDEDFSAVSMGRFGAGHSAGTITIKANTGGAKSLDNTFAPANAELADVEAPEAQSISYIFANSPSLNNIRLYAPKAKTATNLLTNCISIKTAEIYVPAATNIGNSFCSAAKFVSLKINVSSAQTVNINPPSSYNATGWTDFAIEPGGLAACTTFKIYNQHVALTDESIQNAVEALPDWSGTGTTALAQFPAGRLTTAQQSALAAKGWTWSEATD